MFTHNFFGIAAPVLSVVAFILMSEQFLKKETKPSSASWWTWAFLNLIAQSVLGLRERPWQVPDITHLLCASEFGVAIYPQKYGDNSWDVWNKLWVAGAIVGFAFVVTGKPLIALFFSIIADFFCLDSKLAPCLEKSRTGKSPGWTLGWFQQYLKF